RAAVGAPAGVASTQAATDTTNRAAGIIAFSLTPESAACRVHLRGVVEPCVPRTSPPRCEIEDVPDGGHEIDAPLVDVGRHLRMRAVEVANRSVVIASEDRDGRVLMPLAVLAS